MCLKLLKQSYSEEVPVVNKPIDFSILLPNVSGKENSTTAVPSKSYQILLLYFYLSHIFIITISIDSNIPNELIVMIDNFDKQLLEKSYGMSEEKLKELKHTMNTMRQLFVVNPVMNSNNTKEEKSIKNKNSDTSSSNKENIVYPSITLVTPESKANEQKVPNQSVQHSMASVITSDTIKAAVSTVTSKNNNTLSSNKSINEQLNDLDKFLGVEKPKEIMVIIIFIS